MTVQLPFVYIRSDDVIARVIDNQVLIIPLTAGMVDADDSLYSLTPLLRTFGIYWMARGHCWTSLTSYQVNIREMLVQFRKMFSVLSLKW